MDKEFERAVTNELMTLISLARSSGEPNDGIISYLRGVFGGKGFRTKVVARDDQLDGQRLNLYAARSSEPLVLFCAHTDTVPPGEMGLWTKTNGNPRAPVQVGDYIYGLGASDNLGSIACLVTMVKQDMWPDEAAVVFTADEETGALGAQDIVRACIIPKSVRLVVVCEPTNNLVVFGEKGYVAFDIVARGLVEREREGGVEEQDVQMIVVMGQEAHSARPMEGRSALMEAIYAEEVEAICDEVVLNLSCPGVRNKVPGLCAISYVEKERLKPFGRHDRINLRPLLLFLRRFHEIAMEVERIEDRRFKPPQVTMNAGAVTLKGDEIVVSCDLRTVPGFSHYPIIERLLAEAKAFFPDATLRYPYPPLPPLWTHLPEEFLTAFRDVCDPFGKSAYTEAAIFTGAGFPSVIAGPGNLEVHRPNEHIAVSALLEGARLYLRLIEAPSALRFFSKAEEAA